MGADARGVANVFKSSTVKNMVLRSSGSRLSLKPSAPRAATKEDTVAAPFLPSNRERTSAIHNKPPGFNTRWASSRKEP